MPEIETTTIQAVEKVNHNHYATYEKDSHLVHTITELTCQLIDSLSLKHSDNHTTYAGFKTLYFSTPIGIGMGNIGIEKYFELSPGYVFRDFDVIYPNGAYTSGIFQWQEINGCKKIQSPFYFSIRLPNSTLIQFSDNKVVKIFTPSEPKSESELISEVMVFYQDLLSAKVLSIEEITEYSSKLGLRNSDMSKGELTIKKIKSLNPHIHPETIEQRRKAAINRRKNRKTTSSQ